MRRDVPSPAREKKPSRGSWLAGLGQGSAAARPLNGGVLTRWGARAPARGPATAPKLAPVFLARGCSAVTVSAAAEKRQAARRERGEEPKWLGFSRAPAAAWFLIHAKRPLVRRIRSNARDALGQVEAQAGASARGALPAQAQVAAWVRPVRARQAGPSRFSASWAALG